MNGIALEQRRQHALRQIGRRRPLVRRQQQRGMLYGVDNHGKWREKKMNKFGRVRIVDLALQLCLLFLEKININQQMMKLSIANVG